MLWLLVGIVVVAAVSGLYAGSSAVAISPTLIPIFAGLIGIFLMARHVPAFFGMVAVIAFCGAFMCALDFGQGIGNPPTARQLLTSTNTKVSGPIYDEATIVATQLSQMDLSAAETTEIMYSVVLRIIRDEKLTNAEKVTQLREFTSRLREIRK